MKIVVVNRRSVHIAVYSVTLIIVAFIILLLVLQYYHGTEKVSMVMGGRLSQQNLMDENGIPESGNRDVEKFFRPSDLPVLNNRDTKNLIDEYYGKKLSEIILPKHYIKTPEDTILNYFSVLREAANPKNCTQTGCGTLGNATLPYPIAYQFLSTDYQKELSYDKYLATFLNILHISLIKYKEVPVYDNLAGVKRYFVELETIEGSEKDMAYFAYYFGFLDLINEDGKFKISNLDFYGEDFLCAPYHGWQYDAKVSVQVRFGGWCSFIEEMYPTEQYEYIKNIYFKGTDENDYLIQFYQLTNDTDIEIAQYKKREDGQWELIKLDPNECIKDKSN